MYWAKAQRTFKPRGRVCPSCVGGRDPRSWFILGSYAFARDLVGFRQRSEKVLAPVRAFGKWSGGWEKDRRRVNRDGKRGGGGVLVRGIRAAKT